MTGFDDLERRFAALSSGKATKLILGQFGLLAVQRAKERVPKKTGNLARTIRVENVDVERQSVRVVAGGTKVIGYAAMVEFGTRPHIIRPRRAKALFFASQQATTARFGAGAKLKYRLSGSLTAGSVRKYGSGAFVHAKVVHHPGTKAQPYLVPGARKALDEVGLAKAVISVWDSAA